MCICNVIIISYGLRRRKSKFSAHFFSATNLKAIFLFSCREDKIECMDIVLSAKWKKTKASTLRRVRGRTNSACSWCQSTLPLAVPFHHIHWNASLPLAAWTHIAICDASKKRKLNFVINSFFASYNQISKSNKLVFNYLSINALIHNRSQPKIYNGHKLATSTTTNFEI